MTELKKGMIRQIIKRQASQNNIGWERKAEDGIIQLIESLVPEKDISHPTDDYWRGLWKGRNDCISELNSKIKELKGG